LNDECPQGAVAHLSLSSFNLTAAVLSLTVHYM